VMMKSLLAMLVILVVTTGTHAEDSARINPELLTRSWSARWISAPGAPPFDYGVYHFRKAFQVAARPASFVIHVTADNRYQLLVNGERAALGPARGDLNHWRYETVDIARYLRPGKNVLAAVVWNFGELAPMAQVTNKTGFLLQGDGREERIADTNQSWKCTRDTSYAPLPVTNEEVRGYFVAGPGEQVDGKLYPWGWESLDYDDSSWSAALALGPGSPRDASDGPNRWMLVPRAIPMMELSPERPLRLRQSTGVKLPDGFPREQSAVEIPAHQGVRVLLDQTYLTTAYPELTVNGGSGAIVTLSYAESLMIPGDYKGQFQKGNRDQVEGKVFVGYKDVFEPDGGSARIYRPLWWRTYRYVELTIQTGDEPLTVLDLRGIYTGYPFERRARFDGESADLKRILDVGWRTARLCAQETYMDCPYYEQLQYAGDTRVQALVSLYMTGDGRLMRNAIESINNSRTSEGATYSRAPSRMQQYIPPFSLWWIGMVHDYWMYQDDPEFVREMLPGVQAVLAFFGAHQKQNGSLARMPWWNFVDWTREWRGGVPAAGPDGSSAPLDLQLLLAYQWAAEMEESLGSKVLSGEYRRSAGTLQETISKLYWDSNRHLYADTADRSAFSQHTNALAILAGLVTGEEAKSLVDRTLSDRSLVQCSIYFRHYLHSAVNKAGHGDRYQDLLGPWRAMLDLGLTTWAETEDPTRSDCHAWGSSPNFELFRTILGIDSAAPGFRRVMIRPYLGPLTNVSGSIPHPRGEITVRMTLSEGKLHAEISLPDGVAGDLIWRGRSAPLKAGSTKLIL
jgi:alpha-L-rhamnosidase